jgi:FXSXX-COOH protein
MEYYFHDRGWRLVARRRGRTMTKHSARSPEANVDQPADDTELPLADVSSEPLEYVRRRDDPVLAHSLRRILDEIEHGQEATAGFQSSI